jgi:hypothetical protein
MGEWVSATLKDPNKFSTSVEAATNGDLVWSMSVTEIFRQLTHAIVKWTPKICTATI